MTNIIPYIRSSVFYIGYGLITLVWGTLSVIVGWALPYKIRFIFIVFVWSHLVLKWLKLSCGITYEISGKEHLSIDPCVLLVNHQSTWETLFTQTLVCPQTTLIKKELLKIPFFGWAFALLKPIAIDRKRKMGALKQLLKQGNERLNNGIWVTLFPEGTRSSGRRASFQRGGAALAVSAQKPVLVIAHNAGKCWPASDWLKKPGTIQVRISKPIETRDKTIDEVNRIAEAWLEKVLSRLDDNHRN